MRTTFAKGDRRRRAGAFLGLLLLLAAWPGVASAVFIDIANTYVGTVGDTLDVAVTTEDVTGLGVYSYECDLSWYAPRFTVIDVVEAGTLSSGWGDAVYSTGAGALHIAAAGTTPLSGSGTLVILRIELGPSPGGVYLYLDEFTYNEGTPAVTTEYGYVNVLAPPTITVSPNSGEVLIGDTLPFSASSGTPPYTWGTTNPAVATVDPSGVLTGLLPGTVRVWAEDAAAVRDTTNGDIEVRALRVSLPVLSGAPGSFHMIPVTITDVTGLGIRSFELEITYNAAKLTVLGATETGTLTAGWMAPVTMIQPGRVRLASADENPLAGSGTLVFVFATIPLNASGSTALTFADALFDEQYVPILANGSMSVVLPPTISVSPNTKTLLVGETQLFTVGGSPTPPFTWGTTDPAIGTIDASGLFTPVGGGDCRVFVQDAAGAKDTTGTISVYDLRVTAATAVVQTALSSTAIPVTVDRDVSGLGIYGYEFTLSFNPARVTALAATDSGSVSAAWGAPVVHVYPDSIRIVHAGSTPLSGGPGPLIHVYFQPAPGALEGQTSALNFVGLKLNEGSPRPLVTNGVLTVDDTMTGALGPNRAAALSLAQSRPNPTPGETTIQFGLDARDWESLQLSILDSAGRMVREWDLGGAAPGPHAVRWDGRDSIGRRVSSGVYFYRLAGEGEEVTRKLVVLR